MGDLPKPSDDASWTEVERSFFAGGPPEEPQPVGETPRLDDLFPVLRPQPPARQRFAWLRSSVVAGWQRTTLAFGAANAYAWRKVQAGAAALVAAFSVGSINRRRVAFATVSSIVVTGLFAGIVASRNGAPAKVVATNVEAPEIRPAVAQPTPPVAISAPRADVRAPRADAATRPLRAHRKPASASSSAKRPLVTAFMDRETYWAREGRSAPVRSSRPFFSR
jgi:hypothetical protein